MEQLVAGILAHVDAGKTTLSEGLLYLAGCLKKLGRVDHRDAFLDTDAIERERGITIFSKQAVLPLPGCTLTLLDTPGHVDFSSEMERTLQVLDCAILVISGTDGVQGHTHTLWQLLRRYGVPTFLFVNKMDLDGPGRDAVLAQLQRQLSGGCVDFSGPPEGEPFYESVAMCDEDALTQYLEDGTLSDDAISRLIARRQVFPCWFGSALKLEGVQEFLDGLSRFAPRPQYPAAFGAKVYKVARDAQGARLTYLKVTGGTLKVKAPLSGPGWEEKADQLRIYSGAKYQTADEVPAGAVCAVTGLTQTYPGQGLGAEKTSAAPVLEPVLTYRLILPDGVDSFSALARLRQLEEEDPQLHLVWNEALQQIHVQLMGEVQLEVLTRLVEERFHLAVRFDAGGIVYKETIAAPVEGVGHFEPLRHYAEVRLLLEPGEPGSGVQADTVCPEDALDRNWQRLILTHLLEKQHVGVLTGSPITDVKLTLLAGKAHVKHTEGGDFRQATYRAVRQGLRKAESVLLEPWYSFRLEVPQENVGRAMSDLQRMSARFDPPESQGELTLLAGTAPVAALRDYRLEVAAYTKGRGRLFCTVDGYAPCHNAEEVVAALAYDCDSDTENTADSVFCSHGAGTVVRWDQVDALAHVPSPLRPERPEEAPEDSAPRRAPGAAYTGALEQDKELQAIFERTYGPVKRKEFVPRPASSSAGEAQRPARSVPAGPEYLLVDMDIVGYQ